LNQTKGFGIWEFGFRIWVLFLVSLFDADYPA
jgi:hypothetical protein